MNKLRIVKPEWENLRNTLLADAPREAAAFLLAGLVRRHTDTIFTVREVHIVPADGYDAQEDLRLQVSARFFNRIISRAEREDLAVILCHTHPFEGPLFFSRADDIGEERSSQTLHDCLPGLPVGSIVIGPEGALGRIRRQGANDAEPIHELWLTGRRAERITLHRTGPIHSSEEMFARQAVAFGDAGQQFLSDLTVGVVGVGATGSCTAEILTRLGVGQIRLYDPDHVEPSNVSRMFGATLADAADTIPKVDAVARHLRNVRPGISIRTHAVDIASPTAISDLRTCDVIFSCTDRHAPRSIVNDIAYQAGILTLDMGAGLDVQDGKIVGGSIRATLVGPGLPCLICQGIVRPDMIAAETMPAAERAARAAEGYVPGVAHAPSVVTFTCSAAGLATSLFLDALFSFSELEATTVMLDLATFTTQRLRGQRQADCICVQREHRGDTHPYPIAGAIQ